MPPSQPADDSGSSFDPQKRLREIEQMEKKFRDREGGDADGASEDDQKIADEAQQFFKDSTMAVEKAVTGLVDMSNVSSEGAKPAEPDKPDSAAIAADIDDFFDSVDRPPVPMLKSKPSPAPPKQEAAPPPPPPPAEVPVPAAPAAAPDAPAKKPKKGKMDLKTALERLRKGLPMQGGEAPPAAVEPPPPAPPAAPEPSPASERAAAATGPAAEPVAPPVGLRSDLPSLGGAADVARGPLPMGGGQLKERAETVDPEERLRQIEERMRGGGPLWSGIEEGGDDEEPDAVLPVALSSADSMAAGFDQAFTELEQLVKASLGESTTPVLEPLKTADMSSRDVAIPVYPSIAAAGGAEGEGDEPPPVSQADLMKQLEREMRDFRQAAEKALTGEVVEPLAPKDDSQMEISPEKLMEELQRLQALKEALVKRGALPPEA